MPRLFPAGEPLIVNRARVVSVGEDLTLISSAICTEEAMAAAAVLREQGIAVEHLHITTLKPFTDPRVIEALGKAKYGVVTVENHTVIGGLGTAVAELMASRGLAQHLVRIGIEDTFLHGASRSFLMREHGLDVNAILGLCAELIGDRIGPGLKLTAGTAATARRGGETEGL